MIRKMALILAYRVLIRHVASCMEPQKLVIVFMPQKIPRHIHRDKEKHGTKNLKETRSFTRTSLPGIPAVLGTPGLFDSSAPVHLATYKNWYRYIPDSLESLFSL